MRLCARLFLPACLSLWPLLSLAGETTRVVREDVPARFLFTFGLSGQGGVDIIVGEAIASLRTTNGPASSSHTPAGMLECNVPADGATVEMYGFGANKTDASVHLGHVFINGELVGSLSVPEGRQNLSLRAEGEVKVSRLRFTSLPDVYFRDDFMRSPAHQGDWRVVTSGLQMETAIRPELSASPFRMVSSRLERAELRTGNSFWWDYLAACTTRLPKSDGAKVLLGTHLRDADGLWATLERSESALLFRVEQIAGKSRRALLSREIHEHEPSWHEIAFSCREASLDGETWPFKQEVLSTGGEAAIATVGQDVALDDVRFESGHADLRRFLDGFWKAPGAVQPVFKGKDDMAEWAKGRFLWKVEDQRNAAEFRYPLYGEREVVLGNLSTDKGPLMKVTAAENAFFTLSNADDGNLVVQAEAGGGSEARMLPRASHLSLAVERNGLYVDGKRLLEANLSPSGTIRLERLGKSWPSELQVCSPSLRDYTFSRTPAHFEPVSGKWDETSRWRCFPAYNWFGGLGDPAHAVYRYRLEGRGCSVAVAFAPGMSARNGPFYNYPMGLVVALSPDARDPYAGAAVVWEVLTAPTRLILAGQPQGEYKEYATNPHAPAHFQHGFSNTHRRWDIIRLSRDDNTLTVTVNDKQAFSIQNKLLGKCRFLHLLAPSKCIAMISRVCVSAESLVPAASEVRPSQAPPPTDKLPTLSLEGTELRITTPPNDRLWGMFLGAAGLPDEIQAINGGFKVVLKRPALRWALGVQLPQPVQAAAISFRCSTVDLPKGTLYLDSDFGPIAVPLAGSIPPGPYHILQPVTENGIHGVNLVEFAKRSAAYPLIHGIYWGELERDERGCFGLDSHKPGRSLTITELNIRPAFAEGASHDETLSHPIHMPPLSFAPVKITPADGSGQITLPAPELIRALNGDALALRKVLGERLSLGYSDGAGLFLHQGGDGMTAVNPRMGGPAGIWLHTPPFHKSLFPLLYLEYEHIDVLPTLPWNLVAATSTGKVSWTLEDNQLHVPVVGSALKVRGPGKCLYDLDRIHGSTIHDLALADIPWYSSVEWAGIRITRLELGPAIVPGDIIAFEGIQDLEYAFLDTIGPGDRQFQGVAKDGRVKVPALTPGRKYLMEVKHSGTVRLIPLKVIQKREEHIASQNNDKAPSAEPVITVVPREGFLRTDFTQASPVSTLPTNRRGTLPVVNPTPYWFERANRDIAARLGGGLFAEVLDKGTEGYHILRQDSGLPEGMVLRLMYAVPEGSAPTIMLFGKHYSTIRQTGLSASGKWQWLELPLPSETDAIAIAGKNLFALRAVSIAPPAERRFSAAFHNTGDGDALILKLQAKGGEAMPDIELEAGATRVDFELPGPGTYIASGCRRTQDGAVQTMNSLTLTVK